jgi:hypothetical protein
MLKCATESSLLEQLALRPERNAPLINVIERNCQENFITEGNSFCMKDKLSRTHMFSAGEWSEIEVLLKCVENELDTFFVSSTVHSKKLLKRFPGAEISEYDAYVMERMDYIPCTHEIEGFEIKTLDPSWMDFILKRYHDKEFGKERYILDRILKGPGLGLVKDGEKVAFVLQHKDGESGPLVVDRSYRGRGLGSELLKRFNGMLFKKNSILFGFVKSENKSSAKMMIRSGYKKAKDSIIWVYCMKNGTLYLP